MCSVLAPRLPASGPLESCAAEDLNPEKQHALSQKLQGNSFTQLLVYFTLCLLLWGKCKKSKLQSRSLKEIARGGGNKNKNKNKTDNRNTVIA